MTDLIQLNTYPVNVVLDSLLADKTTKKNILFATDAYSADNLNISAKNHMKPEFIRNLATCVIQPRVSKSQSEQNERTKNKAEVFTPSWICNKMNNYCDTEWFGRENVFNYEDDESWIPTSEPIQFSDKKTWQDYVDSRRLEITCGEAPFLVSRYDTTTGEIIPIGRRIGILDRKLRVINENVFTEDEWLKWVCRAFQSVYGYEFQGDNLLIARINLLLTFTEYLQHRWNRNASNDELKRITNVICWNLWQMDGLTGSIPFHKAKGESHQVSLFDFSENTNEKKNTETDEAIDCRIFDWRKKASIRFNSLKKEM